MTAAGGQAQGGQNPAGAAAILALLGKVPMFQYLGSQALGAMASHLKLQTYEPGKIIFQKDDLGSTRHIIAAGAMKIYLPAAGGEEAPLAMLKAGDYFGELALLDSGARTASAMALGRTATLTLEREEFLKFITTNPQGAGAVFKSLAALIKKQNEQLFGEFFGC